MAQQVAQGNREAAGELVRRYQATVRSFLRRLTQQPEVADDLAQDTFINLMRYAHRYDPAYPMRTWLLTIARRLWINHLRKHARQARSGSLEDMPADAAGPATQAARADQQRALRQAVDQALEQLSPPQRLAVVLFHQQDLSIREVAQVMEVPEGTVKSHLHRGRAALRQLLAPTWMETEV